MQTLYDLLGALPHDDAEGLRTAFRKAVKGAHPDLRPGDPDAALRFREIVRANEILGDSEQRAVYDDLLELAYFEEQAASEAIVATRRRKLAVGLSAVGGAAVASIAACLLFLHMSAASVASALDFDLTPPAAAHQSTAESAAAATARVTRDLPADEPKSVPASDNPALGQRDLGGRLAALDQLNPMHLPSYADERVILYRHKPSASAFGKGAGTKVADAASHAKPAPVAKRPQLDQSPVARWVRRLSRQHVAAYDPSRGDGFSTAMMQ